MNQNFAEQQEYAAAKPRPHIEGVILFGSRMKDDSKPRPESDIDCVIVLNRRTKNLSPKIRQSFIECVQNNLKMQGIKLKNIEQGFASQCAYATDFSMLAPYLMPRSALLDKNTELLFPNNPKLKQNLEEAIETKRRTVNFEYQ
ncbi:MAG: nucleotidyltransferase domain-containing protein [Patescibacteria group bacterium]